MLKHIEGVVMNVIVYIIQHNVSGNMNCFDFWVILLTVLMLVVPVRCACVFFI